MKQVDAIGNEKRLYRSVHLFSTACNTTWKKGQRVLWMDYNMEFVRKSRE
jgi:hypothetical protein